jgi:hypothetical protein
MGALVSLDSFVMKSLFEGQKCVHNCGFLFIASADLFI